MQEMPDFNNEVIICFENVTRVIMAEQALTGNKFFVRVMPAPSGIREGCSFCLRFLPEDIERAAAFLFEQGFTNSKAFMKEKTGDLVSYKRIDLTKGGRDATRA